MKDSNHQTSNSSSNGASTPPPETPEKKAPDKSMIFMGMGIEAVVAVLGGFYIGLKLDEFLGKRGLGPAVGSILGLVGWFLHLLRVMKRFDEEP
jgi:F0F1-type ATP synthase assembly protein I